MDEIKQIISQFGVDKFGAVSRVDRLPAISVNPDLGLVSLYYQGPVEFGAGRQKFQFYLDEGIDLDALPLRVRTCFLYFSLSNTVLLRAIHKKNKRQKVKLLPKKAKVAKLFGVWNCGGQGCGRGSGSASRDRTADCIVDTPAMLEFVSQAAKSFDLGFFYPYKNAFMFSIGVYSLSKRKENLLIKHFNKLVKEIQSINHG